ncbi:MAG: TrkH family potassium uptake protein [bacterium]|nr:TrkH family potassium uptake protein [bacterium]
MQIEENQEWKDRWKQRKKKLTSSQIIIIGFATIILVGALLLTLPIASRSGQATPFFDALFTATSAVCVTGLVVYDTATHWSLFGQIIILMLIQIGGMGVVTIAVTITMVSGKKIGLMQRSTLQEAISAPQMGGIVRLTNFIVRTALCIEMIGVLCMAPIFCKREGMVRGLWYAIFHSVSAFCNAGFDLQGTRQPFSSLTSYADNWVINLTIMMLILVGGLGFLTWNEIKTKKFHFRQYRVQSKIVLTMTVLLIVFPTLYFYFGEFQQESSGKRLLLSLFQTVTPRTAGFNTADLTLLSETGIFLMILLMLIGGSTGSTAGGIKTTTMAVLFAVMQAVFRRHQDAHMFGRRIAEETIRSAAAIFLMYVSLFMAGGMVISRIEGLPILTCLFETASAIATVGLSLGVTPQLGAVSRGILILLMFLGRVGGLTIIFATNSELGTYKSRYPQEKIMVG